MLPSFDAETGLLPEGEHVASWDEVVDALGWNQRRRRLLDGLAEAIELLAPALSSPSSSRLNATRSARATSSSR